MNVLYLDGTVTKTELFDAWVNKTQCQFFSVRANRRIQGQITSIDEFKKEDQSVYRIWVENSGGGIAYLTYIHTV